MHIDRMRVFGNVEAVLSTGAPVRLPTRKMKALLSYLALNPNRRFSRDELAGLLWEGVDMERARHSLRQALSVLRRHCPTLLADGDTVSLGSEGLQTDASLIEHILRSDQLDDLTPLLNELTGTPLQDLDGENEVFTDWLRAERERLHGLAYSAQSRFLDRLMQAERFGEAISVALRLLIADPYDEVVHRKLLRSYLALGRRGAAQEHYAALVSLLASELAVEPEDDTTALMWEAGGDDQTAVKAEGLDGLEPAMRLIEQVPHPTIVTDLDGTIIGVSRSAVQLFGLSRDQAIGRTPDVFYSLAAEQISPTKVLEKVVGDGAWSGRMRLISGKLGGKLFNNFVVPLYASNGRIVGTIGSASIA